jgi:hypothetical protein
MGSTARALLTHRRDEIFLVLTLRRNSSLHENATLPDFRHFDLPGMFGRRSVSDQRMLSGR